MTGSALLGLSLAIYCQSLYAEMFFHSLGTVSRDERVTTTKNPSENGRKGS